MNEHDIDNENKKSQLEGIKIDHNVSDIIPPELGKNTNNKGKGLLTILALLIAILIIAIMMGKMVLEENDENKSIKESQSETIVSPDLQLDNSIKESKKEKEELDKLSQVIADDNSDSTTNEIKPETSVVDEEKNNIIEVSTKEEVAKQEQESVVDTPAIEPKVEEADTPVVPTVETPKVEKKKPQVDKSVERSHISSGNYYIQVGSFTTKPSGRFLQSIKKNGFAYKLHPTGKLLIGPYSSRAVAGKDLPRVKDRINKGAFIINMK